MLKFPREKKPTTKPKVANFLIEISNKFCKHNDKEKFQTSIPRNLNCHGRGNKGESERAGGLQYVSYLYIHPKSRYESVNPL